MKARIGTDMRIHILKQYDSRTHEAETFCGIRGKARRVPSCLDATCKECKR